MDDILKLINKKNKSKSEIKKIQTHLNKNGFNVGTVDGIIGKKTNIGISKFLKVNKSKEKVPVVKSSIKRNTNSSIGRDLMKNLGIPLNARQMLHDLTGGEADLTDKDLTKSELVALRKIVRKNLKKGKKYIEYKDYNTESEDVTKKKHTSSKTVKESFKNDTYNLRTTLGSANIEITPENDTIVVDKYDFNDAPIGRDTIPFQDKIKKVFTEKNKSTGDAGNLYRFARNIAKYFGSSPHEGTGSNVRINTNEVNTLGIPDLNLITRDNTNINIPIMKTDKPTLKWGGLLSGLGSAGGSAIPGIGAIASPILGALGGAIGGKIDEVKAEREKYNQTDIVLDPYQLKLGGYLKNGSISGQHDLLKYNGAEHSAGGIPVDGDGIPTNTPDAEVENNETTYTTPKGKKYVFSKTLKL